MSQKNDYSMIDSHIHYFLTPKYFHKLEDVDNELISGLGFDKISCASLTGAADVSKSLTDKDVNVTLNNNLQIILLKAVYPETVFAFGGLHHGLDGFSDNAESYEDQINDLMEMGFDGVKMIEGKPTARKIFNKSLADPILDMYYAYCEKNSVPILFHVADPEEFWDSEKAPAIAKERGWFYAEGDYRKKEELYEEIDTILSGFPKLKVIFAHFYFLSADLNRASDFLSKWENVNIDTTPGSEMYYNFSKDPKKWRNFFIKFRDKIIFGTDILNIRKYEESKSRVKILKNFFETEERAFAEWGLNKGEIHGIGLDKDTLGNIYRNNFERIVGIKPKPVNINIVVKYAEKLQDVFKKNNVDKSAVELAEALTDKIKSVMS